MEPQPFNFGERFEEPIEREGNSPFADRGGQTLLAKGEFASPNFKRDATGSTGWRFTPNSAEIYTGIFSIGGTTVTINNTQDIQENLDAIDAAGGGTLFLQNGTYTLMADVSVPSNVSLQGVSRGGVIIDCNSSFKLQIVGSNAYSTGTVTINNGDTTVVGSGTTWTSAMVGRFILLSGGWYEITARTDNTHITISPAYGASSIAGTPSSGIFPASTGSSPNLTGATYIIATVNSGSKISTLSVTGATGTGVKVQYSQEPSIENVFISDCGTGLEIDDTVFPKVAIFANTNGVNLDMNNVSGGIMDFVKLGNSSTGAGLVMTGCTNTTFFQGLIGDNTTNGGSLTNCDNISFISTVFESNDDHGIELISGNTNIKFILITSKDNGGNNIKLTATSDNTSITASTITGAGGYGINIAASTCDNTQIIAPAFDSNTSGNINDAGTDTSVVGGTSIDTWLTEPQMLSTTVGSLTAGTNTTMNVGLFFIPVSMVINSVTIDVPSVGTSGTVDISLYSQDGSLVFSVTTASISGTGNVTTAVSNVFILAGLYYIAINPNGTTNIDIRGRSISALGLRNVTGKNVSNGTITITAGTPPASFDPTADITVTNTFPLIRLDN